MKIHATVHRIAACIFIGSLLAYLFLTTITVVPKAQAGLDRSISISTGLMIISGATWLVSGFKKKA